MASDAVRGALLHAETIIFGHRSFGSEGCRADTRHCGGTARDFLVRRTAVDGHVFPHRERQLPRTDVRPAVTPSWSSLDRPEGEARFGWSAPVGCRLVGSTALVRCGDVVGSTAGQGGDTRCRAGADQQGQYVSGHAQ